jgi:hypothetical protein
MSRINKRRAMLAAALAVALSGALRASDALGQLGITAALARQQVNAAIERGAVDHSIAAPAFKAVPGPVRARLAHAAIAWAKGHTESDAFRSDYARLRTARKPVPPDVHGTPEEERQQLFQQQVTAIDKLRASVESVDPEARKQLEDEASQAAAALRQLDTPEMRAMQLAGIHHARAESNAKFEEALRRWDADYPEAPARIIARRLKAFLQTCEDVDFAAKLEPRDGRMRFVDLAHESRSNEWKLCYRAGPDAVGAARQAAAAWLAELESQQQIR